MDSFQFTEDEVRKKLEELGYSNISKEKMKIFMRDMEHLVRFESLKNTGSSTWTTDYEDIDDDSRLSTDTKEMRHPVKVPYVSSFDKENNNDSDIFEMRQNVSTSSLASSYMSDSQLNSSTASTVTRRKVARKKDGKFHVFDETLTETESEASDITALEDRLRSLPVRDGPDEQDIYAEDYASDEDEDTSSISSLSSRKSGRQFLPSYIRPVNLQTNQSRTRKFDPVNRYHQFKEEWKLQGVPGERKHNTLRWNVREQMLNCETFQKPRHRHKPNNYEIPTGKKRQALRWEVRSALARI